MAADPKRTVVIVGENGIYKLNQEDWEREQFLIDPAEAGIVNSLNEFGVYLAFLPDVATGFGINCTVVNVKAILKNNIDEE